MNRFLDIKGAYNVRDLGGYKTQDGRALKWRKIFRAGKISNLKESQHTKMAEMNLKSICDFRTLAEQEASPDTWVNLEQLNRFPLPIGEGRLDKMDWMKKAAQGTGKNSHLYHANRSYVLRNAARYRSFFDILLDERNYPLLFHCTAGKDRTGFASVLLLSALGVDDKTIMEDYLLTNDYVNNIFWKEMEAASSKFGFDLEKIKPILIASETYIQGAYDAISEHYGDIGSFLKEEIGLNDTKIQQLQSTLLKS